MKHMCKNCKHCYDAPVFLGFYLGEPFWGTRKRGMCSRFPEHVYVSDSHFCGEWKLSEEYLKTCSVEEL